MDKIEFNDELIRLKTLMNIHESSHEIETANKLIKSLRMEDPARLTKIKVIGYVTTILTNKGTESEKAQNMLKSLINEFPKLRSFSLEVKNQIASPPT